MNIALQALGALAVIGSLIFGLSLYYHKQTFAIWTLFGIIVVVGLDFCLYWQKTIWEKAKKDESTSSQNLKLEHFKQGLFGILVATFEGQSDEQIIKGKEIQGTIKSILNARFKNLDINDAEAREIPTSLISPLSSHEEARGIGRKYNAEVIIWGAITLSGIIPNLTIVNPLSNASLVLEPNTTLLKNTLTHSALNDIKDIQLPDLTDEPIQLVSFITGLKYYNKRDYNRALHYFKESLPEKPTKYINNAIIFFFMGVVHEITLRYDNAISDFNQAIKLNPNLADAYNHRGIVYDSKGEYDKALNDYSEAIKIYPKHAGAFNNRGISYKNRGKLDRAISDFNQAIKLNPNLADAYNNRGTAYVEKGDYDQAISNYNISIKLNPNYSEAYNNRGNAYFDKEVYDRAIADYSNAIKINPKYAGAYNNRGIVFFKITKEYNKAISDFTEAININPEIAGYYSNRAKAYTERGSYDDAISDYNQYIKLNPKQAKAYNDRGNAYADAGKYEMAIIDYNKAIELDHNFEAAYNNRGSEYGKKGHYDQAISDFNKAIKLNPDYAEAYNNRGLAFKNKGEFDQAISDFNKAIKINPNLVRAKNNLKKTLMIKQQNQ